MALDSKRYLLDTSVILDDPNNILRLYDKGTNCIYITNIVLAELNNKKEDLRSEAGYRAREFFRLSDNEDGHPITQSDLPYLPKDIDGKAIENDRYYQLIIQYPEGDTSADESTSVPLFVIYRDDYKITKTHREPYGLNDAKIGEIALDYKLTLITSDISFKISAQVQGIPAQTLRYSQVKDPNDINFDKEILYENDNDLSKPVEMEDFQQITFKQSKKSQDGQVYETGIAKHAITVNGSIQLCDFDTRFGEHFDPDLVRPINVEQKFFYTILTHPQNSVTVATGATGSGKTLIALQAGLELVKDGIVEGIIYARNTVTSNDQHAELGFRKGDEGEKLGYFMYPLYSAVNYTIEQMKTKSLDPHVEFSGNTNSVRKENATAAFMDKYHIEVMDIAHLRGTTISKKFVIIDEAQNMTNATLKLIGTRMGEGTKLALLGDPHQIDHPFLSKRRNALVSLLKKAEVDSFVAGVQLHHTIRSQTADWFDKNF